MHRRDQHSYAYDDQPAYYTSGQMPHQQNADYPMPMAASPYPQRGYDDQGYYISSQTPGSAGDSIQSNQYIRSMTPAVPSSHRYTSGSDPRYYQLQGVGTSSSSVVQPSYSPDGHGYSGQRSHRSNHSTTQPVFIPTPSEMSHSYSNYTHMPQSPTLSDHYPVEYPPPPHIVPSVGSIHQQRPARISTARPRTSTSGASTSPTSCSSPSGERFPCEKCGKTFSRSHDRKRHHETQHLPSPVIHRCRYCEKEFSRADSLKRHLDNGCDEMPQ